MTEKLGKHTLKQVNAQLLNAITACNTSLTGKMKKIKLDIGLLRQDMQLLGNGSQGQNTGFLPWKMISLHSLARSLLLKNKYHSGIKKILKNAFGGTTLEL